MSLHGTTAHRSPPTSGRLAQLLVRKSIGIWWLLLPFGLATVALLPSLLPEQYLFDAQVIREHIAAMGHAASFAVGDSFANTAHLYVVLGVGGSPQLGAHVTYVAAWASVLLALTLASSGGRFWLLVPLAVWHGILLVFTGMHSKEVHAMPAMVALLLLAGRRFSVLRIIAMVVLVAGYSLLFRKYWIVVGGLAAAFILVRQLRLTPLWDIVAILSIFFLLLVSYFLATGEYLTGWRNILTEGRDLDLFSDTAFVNAYPLTSVWLDFVNAMVALAHLLVPYSMLASGKLQHVAFAAWELANVVVFGILVARAWRRRDAPARLVFAAAWVIAFTLTQSTFEPDYGTFLRHQTTLLPLLAFIALETLWPSASNNRTDDQRCAPGYPATRSRSEIAQSVRLP